MPNSRKEQKQATRRKILESAKKLLTEETIDELQVTDIAKGAGVSSGTFYVHFDNKEALFKVILDEFNERMFKLMVNAFEKNISNMEKINFREIAEVFLDQLKDNKIFIVAYASKYGYSLPYSMLLSGANPPLIDFVANALDLVAAENKIEGFDGTVFSHAVMAMWLRVGFRYALLEDADKETIISMLMRLSKAAAYEFMPDQARERLIF